MELKRAVKGGAREQNCPLGFEDGPDEALQSGREGRASAHAAAWEPSMCRMGHVA